MQISKLCQATLLIMESLTKDELKMVLAKAYSLAPEVPLTDDISESDISARCKNLLMFTVGVFHWHELSVWSKTQLCKHLYLGRITLNEIEKQLSLRNLTLLP